MQGSEFYPLFAEISIWVKIFVRPLGVYLSDTEEKVGLPSDTEEKAWKLTHQILRRRGKKKESEGRGTMSLGFIQQNQKKKKMMIEIATRRTRRGRFVLFRGLFSYWVPTNVYLRMEKKKVRTREADWSGFK
ncbi:hypothetical protein WMY93_025985 [Mugilogobius chulae]|uniref:Uncharacterized protein n=1 Tax=Mugilogobius chulae TaxID=88201 RepID=A0AAW0MX58_9GOBI